MLIWCFLVMKKRIKVFLTAKGTGISLWKTCTKYSTLWSPEDTILLEVLPEHLYKANILFPAKGAIILPFQFLLLGGNGGRLNGCSL